MSIRIGAKIMEMGRARPGHHGVPGATFNNKELFDQILQYGLSIRERLGLRFLRSARADVDRNIAKIQTKTGIEQRDIFIGDFLYADDTLATAALLDAINNARKIDPNFNPAKINVFIIATDTRDTAFPVNGKAVLKATGLNPDHFGNNQLACSSIADGIKQALNIMENDPGCEYAAIVATDVTTRLKNTDSLKQAFLFGDQAVCMILKKTSDGGGFILSNTKIDGNAPDIVHPVLHSADSEASYRAFQQDKFGNDDNLSAFGRHEQNVIAAMLRLWLQEKINSALGSRSMTLPKKGQLSCTWQEHMLAMLRDNMSSLCQIDNSNEPKLILPQVGANVFKHVYKKLGVRQKAFDDVLVPNTVTTHAITGAASTPLAIYYQFHPDAAQGTPLEKQYEVQTTFFPKTGGTFIMCAIGGIYAMVTYDPNADKMQEWKYTLNEDTLRLQDFEASDVNENDVNDQELGELGDIAIEVKDKHASSNSKTGNKHRIASDDIVSVIKKQLAGFDLLPIDV